MIRDKDACAGTLGRHRGMGLGIMYCVLSAGVLGQIKGPDIVCSDLVGML